MKAWGRWLAWLDQQETAEPIALFRMGVGLCVFASVATVFADGLVVPLWAEPASGGMRALSNPPWLIALLGGREPEVLWWVGVATMALACATTLGLGGRATVLLTLQGFMALVRCNPDASSGADQLITNALWLLFLSSSTSTWSLDCRLRSGAFSSARLVSAWPRKLIVFQLVLVYFSSALHKGSATWTPIGDYSAIYYVLLQPSWQRFELPGLASVYPLTQIATAGVWLFEIGSPLLLLALYYRGTAERSGRLRAFVNRLDWRIVFAAIGVPMHLGIALLMQVGAFSWISLCFYLCLFTPRELRAVLRVGSARHGSIDDDHARSPAGSPDRV